MDHHVVAAVSLAGIFLDVLGGLYLAYDLLGGQHGPLRLLTRMVTYSIVFGIGYGIGLGLFFGVACGLATGITVSIELQRTARRHDHYPLQWEAVFSAIRGLAFGAATLPDFGPAVRGFICGPDYRGTNVRLFPRDATESGLCGLSAAPADAAACVGSDCPDDRVHCGGAALQCAWCGTSITHGHLRCAAGLVTGLVTGVGIDVQSLHRVLCRQPCRNGAWACSASGWCFAASRCNRFSTGWRSWMCM